MPKYNTLQKESLLDHDLLFSLVNDAMMVYQGFPDDQWGVNIVKAAEAWNLCHANIHQLFSQRLIRRTKPYRSMGQVHGERESITYIDRVTRCKVEFANFSVFDGNSKMYFCAGIILFRAMRKLVKKNKIEKKLMQALLKDSRVEWLRVCLAKEINNINLAVRHYEQKKDSISSNEVVLELQDLQEAGEVLRSMFSDQEIHCKLEEFKNTQKGALVEGRFKLISGSKTYQYYANTKKCRLGRTNKSYSRQFDVEHVLSDDQKKSDLDDDAVGKTQNTVLNIPRKKYDAYRRGARIPRASGKKTLADAISEDYGSGRLKNLYVLFCVDRLDFRLTKTNAKSAYKKI